MESNEAPEKYPMHFRDNIDEYLWHEHGILGGCCSSIESMKYAVAREVAEKLTDKACDAYCKVCGHYHHTVPTHICRRNCDYYDNFKQSMKDETKNL